MRRYLIAWALVNDQWEITSEGVTLSEGKDFAEAHEKVYSPLRERVESGELFNFCIAFRDGMYGFAIHPADPDNGVVYMTNG